MIRPNQVHHFLSMQGWDGWGLSFPAELLPAHLTQEWQNLPYRQVVDASRRIAAACLDATQTLPLCRLAKHQCLTFDSSAITGFSHAVDYALRAKHAA